MLWGPASSKLRCPFYCNALQLEKSSFVQYSVEIKIGLTKNNHFQRIWMASAYPIRWIIPSKWNHSNDDYHQKKTFFLVITSFTCNPSRLLSWKLDLQSSSAIPTFLESSTCNTLSYHCEIQDFSGELQFKAPDVKNFPKRNVRVNLSAIGSLILNRRIYTRYRMSFLL